MRKPPERTTGNAHKANATTTAQVTPLSEPSQFPGVSDGGFNLRRFGGDVLIYATGQGLLLLFGFIQFLIIPKYLPLEDYGYWQLFVLYAGYVGILHFGFINGIHVRWAGKELDQVGNEFTRAFQFVLLEQLVVMPPLSLLLFLLLEPPLQWIGVMVLVYAFIANLGAFFTWTCYAVRKFRLLTVVNIGSGASSLLFIVLFFTLDYLDYQHVVFASLGAYFLVLFAFVFYFRRYLWRRMPSFSSLLAYGKENISLGLFVLLGNFVVVLFMTTDRLFISSFFPIESFAIYAFALTVAAVAYTFVGAVAQVFFPYLSGAASQLRTRAYQLGKPAIMLTWGAGLAMYFPVSKLVEFYLPQYTASLPIMQILLCTVGFGSLIQILHASYYLAYRKQRQYFLWGITSLALLAMLIFLAIRIWGTLQSVASATLISFAVWYVMNELSLKSVVGEDSHELWRGMVILSCYLGAFWLASLLSDWFAAQMLIYVGFFCLISRLLLGSEARELAATAKGWRNLMKK
jgi:O-antigen/teichoic acid export membrane protein